jgi:putative ABC transport system substrate-binding protein
VTGTTDMLPIPRHIELIRELLPQAKRVGTIYNPGEANSVTLVERLRTALAEKDMVLQEAAANKTSDILGAAKSLVGKVDVIYLLTDNTVISAVEAVIKVGEQNSIPVIAADTDTVKRGAVAAYGFNYYDVGRQTGSMVVAILNGKAPAELPVGYVEKLELYLNPGAAARMGIVLPEALLARAKEVVKD